MLLLACFCAGVVLCAFLPVLPSWPLLLTVLLLSWPLWWRTRRLWLLALVAATLGLGYAAWRAELRLAQRLDTALAGEVVQFSGVVRGLAKSGEFGVRLRFEVEAVDNPAIRLPPLLELSDYRQQAWPAGSRWRLAARLRPPRGAANVAGFDAEAWYWSEGVLATGSVLKGRQALGVATDWPARIDRLRERVAQRLLAGGDEPRAAALVAALAVGAQQTLTRDDWQQLAATGLTHVVSVSGLHITMIALLVAWLLRRALRHLPPLRRPLWWVLGGAVLAAGAYAALAGFSVPTQRSLWMLVVAALALASQRGLSPLQIWLAALTLVLLLDPFAALAPGFWLSFGLVAALVVMVAGRRASGGKWQTALQAQLLVTLASTLPLALFFGQLPLVSPLANAVGTPLVSLLLTPLALLAALLPWPWLLDAAVWTAQLFWWWVDLLAGAPLYPVPQLPWPLLLAALAGTLLALLPWSWSGRALGGCLLLPLLLYRVPPPAAGTLAVELLDVGQGLAVLLRTRQHALLYDTGAGEATRVLLPALRALDVRRLDTLMLSHHDNDHDGAAASLREVIEVGRILAGQPRFYPGAQPCRGGQGWVWDGVRFDVLWPPPAWQGEDNAHSCVLRVATAGQALLLSGDAPLAVEQALVARYGAALRSQWLVLGHHGSRTASGDDWLRQVQPQMALVSTGYRNRYRHPHPQVLARLDAAGITVWRSDHDGALALRLGPWQGELLARRAQAARYWRPPPQP